MTVYVDSMRASFGRMLLSHMIADTHEELIGIAEAIDIQKKWIQHKGTAKEHFDISEKKRLIAIEMGAVEITSKELVLKIKEKECLIKQKKQ